MGAPLRVVILSNTDPTSSRLFEAVCTHPGVTVVAVAFTTTLTRSAGFWGGVRDLARTTGFPYFAYMSFRNATFLAKERLVRTAPGLGRVFTRFFSLRAWANARRIPVFDCGDFNEPAFVAAVRALTPDLVMTRVNQILREPLLQSAAQGCWCLHSSPLPNYRGIAAEFHSLVRSEPAIGFTVMLMDRRLDGGPVVAQQTLAIPPGVTLHELIERNIELGRRLVSQALDALAAGALTVRRQDDGGSYVSWPTPAETRAFAAAGHRYISLGEAWSYVRQ